MKIPKRKPDFYFHLTPSHKANGWNRKNHFVIELPLKNGGDIVYALRGTFSTCLHPLEIRDAFFRALLNEYADTIQN